MDLRKQLKELINSSDPLGSEKVEIYLNHEEIDSSESEIYVFISPIPIFENLLTFTVYVLQKLILEDYLEAEYLDSFLNNSVFQELDERNLEKILENLEYKILENELEEMEGVFDSGIIINDSWDRREIVFKTSSKYIGIFWTTYA